MAHAVASAEMGLVVSLKRASVGTTWLLQDNNWFESGDRQGVDAVTKPKRIESIPYHLVGELTAANYVSFSDKQGKEEGLNCVNGFVLLAFLT